MSYIVEVENVWKKFPLMRDKPGFKEFLLNLTQHIKRDSNSYFWALKGVSFQVKKGECLGIIGKNGAGKSTLLSILLGTIYPTMGKVRVFSNITPLLELGAGFHPDLTGRENIFINGVLLGLTIEEVRKKCEDIINFSEIGDFIDMPARTYSSGMYLRLAFSVAIHTDPKLLLIDEILAVGDEAFQKKSNEAIVALIRGGVTTVFVSHSLPAVREICDRVIWLNEGKIMTEGDPEKVIEDYMTLIQR
jgi:ABC-type polysaccharide/polyol phosphate transport system ATPase subunit